MKRAATQSITIFKLSPAALVINARINPRRAQAFNIIAAKEHESHAIEASG
jgi:hypothetical protein